MATTALASTSITGTDPTLIYADPTTTTSTTTTSTDLGSILAAAIAGGYVAHPTATSFTVTQPIVINVTSTIQGPLGIDLGGATIVSQITNGAPVIQINVGPGVDFRYLTLSNFTLVGNGKEGDGIQIIADGNDRWAYNWTISNVTVKNVGGYGLDIHGSVFEGIISNSWMIGDTKGGAYFSHNTGSGGGQVSALRWFGGGFDGNGGAGITLDNGARDISVDGATFTHNANVGIAAASGISSVTSSSFVDNKTAGIWFQNFGNFNDNSFTSSGTQGSGISGYLAGNTSLVGNTSSYTGAGTDPTVLANLQGSGGAFLSGDSGKIVTGSNVAVSSNGGGDLAHVTLSSQGVALPALADVTAATTASVATSSGTSPVETALKSAIANGTVIHLTDATYTVTSAIVINITSSSQGPIGIDLGGAKIVSQITGGGPVIEIVVGAGVDIGTLTLSNFSIQGSGGDGDGIKIVANGTDRMVHNLNIGNVDIEHVGGIGLDVIGNVQGTVFDSWMHGNALGGARFANGTAGGAASSLDWVGGGFRKNGVAGLILENGTHDMTVKGAYFVENSGPGIYATSGITLVQQSGFENNGGTGALVQGTAHFSDDTFSTYGPQTVAIGGYLSGGEVSLVGVSNEYYGSGSDPTVLTNLQGTGTLAIAGTGNVVVGTSITVTGGDPYIPATDTTAPTVSSIVASGSGITSGSGDLNAGKIVTLTVNMSEIVAVTGAPTLTLNDGGTATYTGGSGSTALTFSYTVQAGENTADLAVASLSLSSATIKDAAGNSADLSGAVNYQPAGILQIDTLAPTVSTIATSGAGISSGNGTLGVGKVVTFTVAMSEAVTVTGIPTLTLNDGGIATYAGGSGTSALTFSYTVAAGQNTPDLAVAGFSLNGGSVLDAAGNAANLSAVTGYNPAGTLVVDTTAPTLTEALAIDTGAFSTDGITSISTVTGTAEPGAVVRFTIDGTALAATATANANGAWSFTPAGLADGLHTVIAGTTDMAGNTTSTSISFTLDTAAPAVTEKLVNGTTIVGTGDPNATVHLTLDGSTTSTTVTADATGAWSYTPTSLASGTHTITASETDLAGNTGSASLGFTIGGTAPIVTETLASDTGASATDKITSNPMLSGTADPNAVIRFTIDGTAISATATADASGAWSFTPTALADGAHTVMASETNTQGLTGSTSLSFTLDTQTTAPVFTGGTMANGQITVTGTAEAGATLSIYDGYNWAGFAPVGSDGKFTFVESGDTTISHSFGAIATDLAGNEAKSTTAYVVSPATAPVVTAKLVSDTGASSTDRITSSAALSGIADPNAVVHFTLDGSTVAATATADASGAWSFTPTGLADGAHTIVASETNAAGLTGSTSLSFTLDTTAPVVTEKLVSGTTFSGTGDANAVVHFTLDGTALGTTVTADALGAWTYTATGLAGGNHTLVASETDLAGNTGSASLAFTVGMPPTVTEKLVSDTGSSSTDRITSSAALGGTADPNSIVHFTLDGLALAATATANSSGAWSFTAAGLADGQHTIVASETNAAGLTGSASLAFTLDTTAPVPTFTSVSQANGKATLTGTSEAGSTLSIYDGNTWMGYAATASDGTWSFTAKAAANVVHSYGALATDIAGNQGRTSGMAILGSSSGDSLSGGAAGDIIVGNGGNDAIAGGGGADTLTGGAGSDTFVFNAAFESTAAAADTITDFVHGTDKIDFTTIAGINATAGVPQFQGNITGTGNLTLNAHSVAFLETGGNTVVLANTSNAAETVTTTDTHAADMKIVLLGVNLGLTGTDFHHS